MDHEFNPICTLFPPITGQEMADLTADIAANGLRDPIELDPQGRIVDGRNRHTACLAAGVEPRFVQCPVPEDGLVAYVISKNLMRRHLWDGRAWLDQSLEGYGFQQLLVWHYPNNIKPQSRSGFKQTWEPILFYRRSESDRAIVSGGESWGDGLNTFDCHVAPVPQTNFNDANRKTHPAQKPLSVMRWLVNAVTLPGEMVCDPFMGSGTTGIAAVELGRRFHGIEIDQDYLELSGQRIAAYAK